MNGGVRAAVEDAADQAALAKEEKAADASADAGEARQRNRRRRNRTAFRKAERRIRPERTAGTMRTRPCRLAAARSSRGIRGRR